MIYYEFIPNEITKKYQTANWEKNLILVEIKPKILSNYELWNYTADLLKAMLNHIFPCPIISLPFFIEVKKGDKLKLML